APAAGQAIDYQVPGRPAAHRSVRVAASVQVAGDGGAHFSRPTTEAWHQHLAVATKSQAVVGVELPGDAVHQGGEVPVVPLLNLLRADPLAADAGLARPPARQRRRRDAGRPPAASERIR